MTPDTSADSVEGVHISHNADISVQRTDDTVTDGNITDHVNDDSLDTLTLGQVSDKSDALSLGDSLSSTDFVGNNTSELRQEQLEDETFTGAFDFARHNKDGYLIKMVCFSIVPRSLIIQLSDWLCRKDGANPYWNWQMKN